MLSQANRVSRQTQSGRRRRAMSADQSMIRAQERMNTNINAAINAGNVAQLQKSMNVTLRLPTNSSLKLVSADGTVSAEGRHYYNTIGINPPTIFAYEQPLINNKWVNAFDGTKKMVQRMTTDGWEPT